MFAFSFQSITNRSTPRNYIYSEDRSIHEPGFVESNKNDSNERTLLERSTSVDGDDYQECSSVNQVIDDKPSTWSLRSSWSKPSSVSAINKKSGDNDEVRRLSSDAYYSEPKHLRQYSDSLVVDSAKCKDNLYDFTSTITTNPSVSGGSSESEARDAVTTLEPRTSLLTFHRTGVPFRSASFGQVDFNQGN